MSEIYKIIIFILFLLLSSATISTAQETINIEDINLIENHVNWDGIVLDIDYNTGSVLISSPAFLPHNTTILLHNLSKTDMNKLTIGKKIAYSGRGFSINLFDATLLTPVGELRAGRYILKSIPEAKKLISISQKSPNIAKNTIKTAIIGAFVIELTDGTIQERTPTQNVSGFEGVVMIFVFSILYFIIKRD